MNAHDAITTLLNGLHRTTISPDATLRRGIIGMICSLIRENPEIIALIGESRADAGFTQGELRLLAGTHNQATRQG